MIFKHFLIDVNEVNGFLVACEETKEAILIDVGEFDSAIDAFIKEHGLKLTKIFITHDHFDHTGGLAEAASSHDVEVFAGKSNAGSIRATKVGHGDEIRVGNLVGKVLKTPGHTMDGLCLVFPGMVFSGDTLFAGSIGGTTSPEQEKESIVSHIFSLPDDYEIHPGHGPSSTVKVEKTLNPFFC